MEITNTDDLTRRALIMSVHDSVTKDELVPSGDTELDRFTGYILRDIRYARRSKSPNSNFWVHELTYLAMSFAKIIVLDSKLSKSSEASKPHKPARSFKPYKYTILNTLAGLECHIYASPERTVFKNKEDINIGIVDLEERLEMIGMKKGTVLDNYSIKAAYDLIAEIYDTPYVGCEYDIASLILAAQEYAYNVFKAFDLVGVEELLEQAEHEFIDIIIHIRRAIKRDLAIARSNSMSDEADSGKKKQFIKSAF